jgi:hypothetical protein
VGGKCSHPGTDLNDVIPGKWIQASDNGLGQVRIEQKILPQNLAWAHPYLLKAGTQFGFGHGDSFKGFSSQAPAVMNEDFVAIVPKLFTGEKGFGSCIRASARKAGVKSRHQLGRGTGNSNSFRSLSVDPSYFRLLSS